MVFLLLQLCVGQRTAQAHVYLGVFGDTNAHLVQSPSHGNGAVLGIAYHQPPGEHGVDTVLGGLIDYGGDLLKAVLRNGELHDGGENLFIPNIFVNHPSIGVQQRGKRIAWLKYNTHLGQGNCDDLHILHPASDGGTAKLKSETHLTALDAPGDIVGFYLLCATAAHPCALMLFRGVTKYLSDSAGPLANLLRFIEGFTGTFNLPYADPALYALLLVNQGLSVFYVNCALRTEGKALLASDT